MIGLTLATLGICSALVQGLLIGPIVERLGPRPTLLTGLLLGSAGLAIYGMAPSGPWFWVGVPAMALWSMSSPALQAMATGLVGASEQGQLQGANNSLRSLSGVVGPGIFGGLFAWLVDPLPGASFLLATLLLIAAAITGWLVTEPSSPAADQHP
jgi:DHA1 family tetracycline resistance protein-like MFS transporter